MSGYGSNRGEQSMRNNKERERKKVLSPQKASHVRGSVRGGGGYLEAYKINVLNSTHHISVCIQIVYLKIPFLVLKTSYTMNSLWKRVCVSYRVGWQLYAILSVLFLF